MGLGLGAQGGHFARAGAASLSAAALASGEPKASRWLAPWPGGTEDVGCNTVTAVETCQWMAANNLNLNLTVDTAARAQWYEKQIYDAATATGKRALMWAAAPGQGVRVSRTRSCHRDSDWPQ